MEAGTVAGLRLRERSRPGSSLRECRNRTPAAGSHRKSGRARNTKATARVARRSEPNNVSARRHSHAHNCGRHAARRPDRGRNPEARGTWGAGSRSGPSQGARVMTPAPATRRGMNHRLRAIDARMAAAVAAQAVAHAHAVGRVRSAQLPDGQPMSQRICICTGSILRGPPAMRDCTAQKGTSTYRWPRRTPGHGRTISLFS